MPVRAADPTLHTQGGRDSLRLGGSITAFVGDQRIDVEAGSYMTLPQNLPHGLTVKDDLARILIILEPAGSSTSSSRAMSDSDPAKFGLEIVGPAPEVGPSGRRAALPTRGPEEPLRRLSSRRKDWKRERDHDHRDPDA